MTPALAPPVVLINTPTAFRIMSFSWLRTRIQGPDLALTSPRSRLSPPSLSIHSPLSQGLSDLNSVQPSKEWRTLLPSDSGSKIRASSMGARSPRSIEPWETVAAVQYVDMPPQRLFSFF